MFAQSRVVPPVTRIERHSQGEACVFASLARKLDAREHRQSSLGMFFTTACKFRARQHLDFHIIGLNHFRQECEYSGFDIIDFAHKYAFGCFVKVPFHVVQARREKLARLLAQHRYLPVKELCRQLGVSEATARRDLAVLVEEKKITRTFGGALTEFNDRFPSFRERQVRAARAKAKIARVARSFIEPERTYFFDSGTTIFALAEAFREKPVTPTTVVTSNLPVGEMLATIPGVRIFQLAGELLHRQSTLVGESAQKSVEFWNFDTAFLSAEAMNAEGVWNSQAVIIAQQKVVLRRSNRSIFCIDGSKLNRSAPHFLLPWNQVDRLLTDVPFESLVQAGISIGKQHYISGSERQTETQAPNEVTSNLGETETSEFPVHIL